MASEVGSARTHAWAWSLTSRERLSGRAVAEIASADPILVSPVGFFEIAQKVRIGKWPEMAPYVLRLPVLLDEQGGAFARLDPEISITAGTMAWGLTAIRSIVSSPQRRSIAGLRSFQPIQSSTATSRAYGDEERPLPRCLCRSPESRTSIPPTGQIWRTMCGRLAVATASGRSVLD